MTLYRGTRRLCLMLLLFALYATIPPENVTSTAEQAWMIAWFLGILVLLVNGLWVFGRPHAYEE